MGLKDGESPFSDTPMKTLGGYKSKSINSTNLQFHTVNSVAKTTLTKVFCPNRCRDGAFMG